MRAIFVQGTEAPVPVSENDDLLIDQSNAPRRTAPVPHF
jgi:hypothetical protein